MWVYKNQLCAVILADFTPSVYEIRTNKNVRAKIQQVVLDGARTINKNDFAILCRNCATVYEIRII